MASILEHLEHEMNNYRESMENMTRTFMNQFLGLVRDYVECTMLISHEADLVGPTIPEGCLSGGCESPYPFIPEFQVDTHLSNFQGKEDISSPLLHVHLPLKLAFPCPENVWIPLAYESLRSASNMKMMLVCMIMTMMRSLS